MYIPHMFVRRLHSLEADFKQRASSLPASGQPRKRGLGWILGQIKNCAG